MNQDKCTLQAKISIKQQLNAGLTDKQYQIIENHLNWIYVAGYEEGRKSVRAGNQKRVRRSSDGREFNSANQAAKTMGVTHTAIIKAVKKNRTCCRTFWRYV